jgi:polyphosphate kinase
MLERTHIPEALWWVVPADDKNKARLNCIRHLLGQVPYLGVEHLTIDLPPRERSADYARQAVLMEILVPGAY